MTTSSPDPYAVLDLASNATEAEIKQAYRRKAAFYHPDRNHATDAAERFREVQEAYDLLSDEARRDAFDSKRQKQLVEDADIAARTIWKTYLGGIRA